MGYGINTYLYGFNITINSGTVTKIALSNSGICNVNGGTVNNLTILAPANGSTVNMTGGTIAYFSNNSTNTTINQTGGSIEGGTGMPALRSIQYLSNSGSGTMSAQKVVSGSTVKLKACAFTPPTGTAFDGWKVENSTTTYANEANVTVNSDLTLVAQWRSPHTHSWGYSANGNVITATCSGAGTCSVSPAPTLTLNAPANLTYDGSAKPATLSKNATWTANITAADPTISYQKKTGENTWDTATTTAPTGEGTYKASVTITGATAVVEFTITAVTYPVKYDANGGSGTMADTTAKISDIFTFPACGFTAPANKVFSNWEITGDDGIYYPEQTLGILNKHILLDKITVTAQWKDATYKLVPEKAASCTAKGKKSHYEAEDGRPYSKNGETYTLIENESTLDIPALGHDYKDGKCTRCGAKDPNYKEPEPEPTPTPTPTPDPTPSPTPSTPSAPVKKAEPKIGDKEGIPAVVEEIGKIPEGGTLPIDMNGTTELPKEIISAIAGKDVNIELDMGGGIKWTINGKSVTDATKNIDLGVTVGKSGIPSDVLNKVTGEKYNVVLSLKHNGPFGFTATLTVELRKQDAGLFANLYYYNPKTKALELIASGKIKDDGTVDLEFGHASDYTIIVDDHPLDNPQLTATADGSSVKLAWDPVSGATSYNVYYVKDSKWKLLKTTGRTELTVSKLANNKTYRFMVRATVGGKLVAKDDALTADAKVSYKPVLKASVKDSKITLKWNAVNGAEKYAVYKYVNGKWTLVKETTKLSQTISGVKSGKTYRYAVSAYVNGKWTSVGTASKATVKVK